MAKLFQLNLEKEQKQQNKSMVDAHPENVSPNF